MFRILPQTKRNKGFTLIELMVVIAIIAIISAVGIAIFQGQQKSARDSRRKADIEAIAQVMEAHYGSTTAGRYDAMSASWFSSGVIPVDPINTNDPNTPGGNGACPGICKYCVYQGTSQQSPAKWCTDGEVTVQEGQPTGGTTNPYWMVCSNLEANVRFCRGNAQ